MIEVVKSLYFIFILINFIVAFFVLIKGKRKKIKWSFFILILILNGWLATNYLAYFTGDIPGTRIFGYVTFLFGTLIMPSFLLFCLNFPFSSPINRWIKFLLTIPPLLFCYLSFTNLFLKNQIIGSDGIAIPVYGDYHFIFGIYIFYYLFLSFRLLIQKYSKSEPIEKVKLTYIIISFGVASFLGVLADIILPIFIENSRSYWGSLGTILISIAFAYSILRHRFMDISVVIRKGFIHFISIAGILFLYIYLLLFFQKHLTEQYGWSDQTLTIALILVIVSTIEPLRRFLYKNIQKGFDSKEKSAKEEESKMQMILLSSMQFDKLIQKVNMQLTDFLEIENIRFILLNQKTGKLENYNSKDPAISWDSIHPVSQYFREHPEVLITEEIPYRIEELENGEKESLLAVEKELKGLRIGMVIPIGEKGELVGAFLLGRKKEKAAFTSDNVEYLSKLQFQMTNAIANALLYKQAVERIAKE